MNRAIAMMVRAGLAWLAVSSAMPAQASELNAEQILDKYAAATGGVDAWHKVQSMVWVGHIQGPDVPASSLPFVLEFKRPNKMRFEVGAQSRSGIHIYDGERGWKVRITSSGQPTVQPYSQQELSSARDAEGLDGPLIDYKTKGVAVALDGTDDIAGHKAYRLNVTPPSGVGRHIWIDAQSFLEVQAERVPARSALKTHPVLVSYRDYQTVEGVRIPFTVATGAAEQDKMVIDRVAVNQPLDDHLFDMPVLPGQHHTHARGPESLHSRFRPGQPAWPMSRPFGQPGVTPIPAPGSGK